VGVLISLAIWVGCHANVAYPYAEISLNPCLLGGSALGFLGA